MSGGKKDQLMGESRHRRTSLNTIWQVVEGTRHTRHFEFGSMGLYDISLLTTMSAEANLTDKKSGGHYGG